MAKPKKVEKPKKELFPVYGEFDSYEEINQAAAGLLKEGDLDGLRALAGENGLEEEAEWYISGDTEVLCDPVSAALGKLKVEKEYEGNMLLSDIADYLASECDDFEFAMNIRKKGKRTREALERIVAEVNNDEHKVSGLKGMEKYPNGYCVACGPMKAFRIIKEYYKGGR